VPEKSESTYPQRLSNPVGDIADWVRLAATPGVGHETARRLLAAFGLPANIFSATHDALRAIVSERIASALSGEPSLPISQQIDKTLDWLSQPGNRLLSLADTGYPQALLDIPDPPIMLYAKGRIELLQRRSLAVVGSRNATAQGAANAEQFSDALSAAGLTIVSGMALGIDTAAHRGGLRHAAGSTVAVIGTGCDIVYPARNRELAHQIAEGGCIVSEYPIGTPAIGANFPRRNRIISGLSQAVLVIEAAAASGSLITARMAAEQGRDVLAIPGSIHSPLAKGCHQLIKQGAKLVESAQDVLDEIRIHPDVSASSPACAAVSAGNVASCAPAKVDPLLDAIGFDPVALDVLACRADVPMAALQTQLLLLELDGIVEMLPGNIVRRVH
jgi:DNA processing protein